MNRQLLIGLVAGAGAATAVGAVANYARVTSVPESAYAGVPAAGVVDRQAGTAAALASTPAGVGVAAGAAAPASAQSPASAETATTDAPGVRPDPAPAPRKIVAEPRAPRETHARVVDVRPVTESVQQPREVCRDEPVVRQAPVRDERRIAGTIAGAVIGGLLGNQVGDGRGRKIATVAGAAAGGYAGNRIQDRIQDQRTVTTTERRCETVYDQQQRTLGYDVTYTYEGRTGTVRMAQSPGERLPVRGGRVVTTEA